MQQIIVFCTFSMCLWNYVNALNLPGPLVYVVTPSPRPPNGDEGRSAPFYYHNWKRRMDTPRNTTTPMMSKTPKMKTPDLIFAEFESDNNNNMKSIRKLLEKEKIEPKTTTTTTTTSRPIYVPDEQMDTMAYHVNYGLPMKKDEEKKIDMTDYYALYNNMYENNENLPAPVYSTSAKPNSAQTPSTTITTKTISTTTPAPMKLENIWHIIDSQKVDQPPGTWEEEPITSENSPDTLGETSQQEDEKSQKSKDYPVIDENFALPGFSTVPGNGAENESRAIRTESNIRFPYVNLKPFQIKNPLLNGLSNSKKTTNMFTNVDSFQEVKNPVRGEAQDYVPMRQPIDRYNPAQPYLPPTDYGSKSKQSSPNSSPVKTVANLVPPPPPPPTPKLTDENFPSPSSYESFPPYAPSGPDSSPTLPSPPPSSKPSPPRSQPPVDTSNDSDLDSSPPSDTGGPSIDLGYNYKSPSPPAQHFVPTLPPLTKPFYGYSYNKPPMTVDSPPMMDMEDKPDFNGYQYSKPAPPSPPSNHPSISYGHHKAPDSHSHYNEDSDYPELIFNKPYGGMSDTKGGDEMKATDGIGMMPPPAPPTDMGTDMDSPGPSDDHGFPHDFPGDFKYHHDFDDHDEYHHHHHTTTTTETPRVNRYSYYYLGKKLYYLPLYFSVYFIVYVGALIIKAVLRHKIIYPNSWRPNEQTAAFFSKRSVDSWNLSNDNLHEITGKVTHAIATAANKYLSGKKE